MLLRLAKELAICTIAKRLVNCYANLHALTITYTLHTLPLYVQVHNKYVLTYICIYILATYCKTQ